MSTSTIIKQLMENQEVKVATLSNRLNISPSALCMRFKQRNISVSKVVEMLRALDYKLVIMPRNARIPEGGYEVE